MTDSQKRLRDAAKRAKNAPLYSCAIEEIRYYKLANPSAIFELLAALEWAEADAARYMKRFRHYHVNAQNGTDRCKDCGFDLRDPIHRVDNGASLMRAQKDSINRSNAAQFAAIDAARKD